MALDLSKQGTERCRNYESEGPFVLDRIELKPMRSQSAEAGHVVTCLTDARANHALPKPHPYKNLDSKLPLIFMIDNHPL